MVLLHSGLSFEWCCCDISFIIPAASTQSDNLALDFAQPQSMDSFSWFHGWVQCYFSFKTTKVKKTSHLQNCDGLSEFPEGNRDLKGYSCGNPARSQSGDHWRPPSLIAGARVLLIALQLALLAAPNSRVIASQLAHLHSARIPFPEKNAQPRIFVPDLIVLRLALI